MTILPRSSRYAVADQRCGDPKVVYEGLDGVNLHAALGHARQLATLLSKGGSPNVVERDGDRVPLHYAAARGYVRARLEATGPFPCLSSATEADPHL